MSGGVPANERGFVMPQEPTIPREWVERLNAFKAFSSAADLAKAHPPPHKSASGGMEIWHYPLGVAAGTLYSIHVSVSGDGAPMAYMYTEPTDAPDTARPKPLPWYLWPLVPPVAVVVAVVVGIPLGIVALLSIPYFWLYPDRHAHLADVEGTDRQKMQLRRWRLAYARLSIVGRARRVMRLSVRRRRAA